ncbi:MAG: hypothetical protein ABI134_09495 [Byssovorax sp.]
MVLGSGRGATERTDLSPGSAEASRIAAPHLLGAELEQRNVRLVQAKAGELEGAPDGVHRTGPG